MNEQLNLEFLLIQQSRCALKYQALSDDFQKIPEKVNKSINMPMKKFNKSISSLVKNRGKMLLLLDKSVRRLLRNIKCKSIDYNNY